MFFGTQKKLLPPIHSLLSEPFHFHAEASFAERLHPALMPRDDFDSLLALAALYDKLRTQVHATLVPVRPRLAQEFAMVVTPEQTQHVCSTEFAGATPSLPGLDGARYLSYVSVQCQLERLYDLMELRQAGGNDALASLEVTDAVRLLMLSEVLALCLAGIARVDLISEQFIVSARDQLAKDTLRATWFARIADQGSHAGTLVLAKDLAEANAMTVDQVARLSERILNQDLSITWESLTPQGRALQTVQHSYQTAALIALLSVLGLRNETLKMNGPSLTKHGLKFSLVAALLRRQGEALVTDQFVELRDGTLHLRIGAASKGLRQDFRRLSDEFAERDILRHHVGGFFFEKTHIRQRLANGADFQPRYAIIEGFTRDQVIGSNVASECDIEFILHDKQQHHYYFIQIKHALLGEKAFFNAAVQAVQKDLGKGIHQLREAKRLLEQGLLAETLAKHEIIDANPANSTFILLHNIAQFDFQYTQDGISLYDWASFRNLLKDGECYSGASNGPREWVRLGSPLVITHPLHVIKRLLDEHPAYVSNYRDPWATERATTTYTIMNHTIVVKGLGI